MFCFIFNYGHGRISSGWELAPLFKIGFLVVYIEQSCLSNCEHACVGWLVKNRTSEQVEFRNSDPTSSPWMWGISRPTFKRKNIQDILNVCELIPIFFYQNPSHEVFLSWSPMRAYIKNVHAVIESYPNHSLFLFNWFQQVVDIDFVRRSYFLLISSNDVN